MRLRMRFMVRPAWPIYFRGMNSVTAIIPTFNRREYVARAIRSVLVQHHRPDEILVIDDGSTDGTAEALHREFGDQLQLIQQPNGGVSSARRRGLAEAKGEWIAFLDSDDEWTPGRSEVFQSVMADVAPDVCWIFGDTRIVDDTGDRKTLYQEWGFALATSPTIFDGPQTQYPHQFSLLQSSMIRRRELVASHAFAEDLRSSEDFLVSFRCALHAKFIAVSDVVTRLHRTTDLAASSLDRIGKQGPDYYRARILAFDEAATQLRRRDWAPLHAAAVRGCCVAMAREGRDSKALALQQFRHGFTLKALVFACAAMLGAGPLRLVGTRLPSECRSR